MLLICSPERMPLLEMKLQQGQMVEAVGVGGVVDGGDFSVVGLWRSPKRLLAGHV